MRALALALVALALLPTPAAAARIPLADARSALDTLATLRGPGGGYDPGMAPLAVEAAAALGIDPALWPSRERSALAALRPAGNGTLLEQVRSIHARAVAGRGTPADAAAAEATFQEGQFGDIVLLNDDVWAIRALRALGTSASDAYLQASARRVASHQDPGGGWPWRIGGSPSVDVTGMAAVALVQAGALPPEAAAAARGYLAARHNATTGGFSEHEAGGAANCDSTVWAVRGLHALGQPAPPSALAYLASLHQPDGGYAY
ncbi:MAG TPA: hypothetical protein VHI93_02690 [Candidatus Thermoplasmatota archaeon]|nr:hypothetical protein [Candidatus Thermoplasmatota archaeon]